jgi:hypothetical protein
MTSPAFWSDSDVAQHGDEHEIKWRATVDEDGKNIASPWRYDALSGSVQRRAAIAAAGRKYCASR